MIETSPAAGAEPVLRASQLSDRKSLSRSAVRALDVLEYFGDVREPLRAIDIVRALDLHPSSTNQLLKTLVASGHLLFDARSKTYVPGPRLVRFSSWVVDSYGDKDRFHGLLGEVQTRTGGVATLTTPNDLFMQIVDLTGPLPPTSSAERGYQVSVFGSAAIGDAYLSVLPDREVRRLMRRARLPRQETTSVLQRVSRTRSAGFAEGVSYDGGFYSVAAPLPRGASPVPMVVAVAQNAQAVSERRGLERTMREAITRWFT
jgi:DNA-binding IclR family transcriptional regulator